MRKRAEGRKSSEGKKVNARNCVPAKNQSQLSGSRNTPTSNIGEEKKTEKEIGERRSKATCDPTARTRPKTRITQQRLLCRRHTPRGGKRMTNQRVLQGGPVGGGKRDARKKRRRRCGGPNWRSKGEGPGCGVVCGRETKPKRGNFAFDVLEA